MRRFVSIVIVLVVLLLVGGGIYVAWSLSQPAVSGPFTRVAEPQVLWGGGEVDVGLSLSAEALPSCAPTKRAADVVLLIDQSGSMDGVPFQQAVAAADTFVQTVDLTVNQVAVLFFNDNATVMQPLTNDIALLQSTLQAQQAGGGTEIHKALGTAQGVLFGPQRRPDANSVLILLSDGGASDPDVTMKAGQSLKEGGVRIVTLALSPNEEERVFMRLLASRPSDAHDNPDDLTTIYRSLAEQINTGVAFNVDIEETLNTDSFDLIADSVQPPAAEQTEATINWAVASLPEGGSMFRYRLTTKGFGLRTISESPIEPYGSLKDCEGDTPRWTLPNGPEVLILPPLWLCLPFLLLPLLLFGFFNWFGRKKPAPPPPPARARRQEPTVAPDETPEWLKQLSSGLMLAREGGKAEASRLQDTLLIGCGPAGGEVLLQMAQVLRSRFGSHPPDNVRLMQIDIELQGGDSSVASLPRELQPFIQHVILRPNLDEVDNNLHDRPEDWAHWAWYKDADKERAQGRMAVFYDLRNGNANSELWSALHKIFDNLQSPRVRLIGTTFDETASGMLVDVARLTQVVTNKPLDVEFWLAGPVGQDWSSSLQNAKQLVRLDDQQARTLATLREVERFQRNTRMPFIYVPATSGQSQLRDSAGGVVQTLFLFQSKQERSSVAPENDVLVCMAESLLALLHPDVNNALIQHLSSNRVVAGRKMNDEGLGMACAIGSYAFRLPGQALVDALTWRFVHDLLYDASIGLVPRDHCQSDGRFQALSEDDREDLIHNTQLREAAERFMNRFADGSEEIGSLAFTVRLRHELDQILNGHDDVMERSNGLQKAQAWLKYVRALVLRKRKQSVARQIDQVREELQAWESWLLGNVYALNQQRWQQARAELERLRRQRARNWLVDDQLEWPLYQQNIRPWLRTPRGGSNQPLLRASQRFGWEVRTDAESDGWKINLLVPPPDFIWGNSRTAVQRYVIRRTDSADALLDRLSEIGQTFTRLKNDAELVLARAQLQNAKQWLELAAPRLQYNKTEASHQMGRTNDGAILVGPRSSELNVMQSKLNRVQAALQLSTAQTDDNSAVTLLEFVDWVPLSTITGLYDQEAWEMNQPHPELYVWEAEQVAAKMEKEGHSYSAIFRGWLALDEKVVELFARSYLYNAYDATQQGWRLLGVGLVSGHSPADILQRLVQHPPASLKHGRDDTLATWEHAIAQQEQVIAQHGKQAYFDKIRGHKITPLLESRRVEEQDLGRYVVYLMR